MLSSSLATLVSCCLDRLGASAGSHFGLSSSPECKVGLVESSPVTPVSDCDPAARSANCGGAAAGALQVSCRRPSNMALWNCQPLGCFRGLCPSSGAHLPLIGAAVNTCCDSILITSPLVILRVLIFALKRAGSIENSSSSELNRPSGAPTLPNFSALRFCTRKGSPCPPTPLCCH